MANVASPLPTLRADLITRLSQDVSYDIAIVGGGATGLGVALDAAARGLKVVLVESHDFAKGTSSRATRTTESWMNPSAMGYTPPQPPTIRTILSTRSAPARTARS